MRPATCLAAAVALAASAAALSIPPQAQAQPYRGAQLRGLDISTASGAAEAALRIDRAARLFCGLKGDRGRTYADLVTLKCRRDLTERTIQHLGAPQVEGAYRLRAGPGSPMG